MSTENVSLRVWGKTNIMSEGDLWLRRGSASPMTLSFELSVLCVCVCVCVCFSFSRLVVLLRLKNQNWQAIYQKS